MMHGKNWGIYLGLNYIEYKIKRGLVAYWQVVHFICVMFMLLDYKNYTFVIKGL